MQSHHIRALTGLRFFAAFLVVLYHVNQAEAQVFRAVHPTLAHLTQPMIVVGNRGVDLFFLLSGFVLAYNYLDRLGPRFGFAAARTFVWLRLARIWPLYMLVTIGAGILIALQHRHDPDVTASRLDGGWFFRQVLLVQQWTEPRIWFSSWAGPAWSLSAEWLAYLCFPFLALAVWRLRHLLGARSLIIGAHLCLTPLLILLLVNAEIGGKYAWLVRIGCEFTAGMLLCAARSQIRLTDRFRTRAGLASMALVLGVVLVAGVSQLLDGYEWSGNLVIFLFPGLVLCLASGSGPLERLLATRPLILGGEISYGLYLVHAPLFDAFKTFRDVVLPGASAATAFHVAVVWTLVGGIALAWLLYTVVEVPARRTMRRMLDVPTEQPERITTKGSAAI